jgi:threonine dehydratase
VIITRPSVSDIFAAHDRIKPFINNTPVISSNSINEIVGAYVYFKCENMQKVGAFKMRGAANATLSLTPEERERGVATHSSGNHAQALALAGRMLNIPAHIVMPTSAPEIKKRGVEAYGGQIYFCEPTLAARESTLAQVVEKTGATFIHPYNNYKVIEGQATAAKEMIDETGELDLVMCPVGGGGLLSGTALYVKGVFKNTKVIAGEPEGADDAFRSLKSGKIEPSIDPKTISDGLLTSLGDKTFPIIQELVDEIVTVSEKEIIEAMRLIWERLKVVVEPSSAVPFAALLKIKDQFLGQKIGIILSGGNVDLKKLPF